MQEGSSVLLNKTSDTGWSIKASMIVSKGSSNLDAATKGLAQPVHTYDFNV